ncbi:MAG: VWA domain-containing protein [Phycisphaerales bacterium]|nr:VWA domain-containing protein [Phycisphaerales bacterium]NNM24479.1 VWA domain-containing protein [Phycisphaerales bacterium]
MSFLTPGPALLAALLVLPPLILLYLLKLRRRRLQWPSTLLWSKSFEDLQVNAPFQRLRLTPLFLLQLLLILALLLAFAQPVITSDGAAASRVIILLDRSASMATRDVPGDAGPITRFEAARAAAREVVDRLAGSGDPTPVMIIGFGASAQVVCSYEARRAVLLDVIAGMTVTDEQADLDAALDLAGTFARGGEEPDVDPPDVLLISDGGVAPPREAAGFGLAAGRFRFIAVGPDGPAENVGITALNARRDYRDPSQVLVFARLINAGPDPVETLVELRLGDAEGPLESVRIPAATPPGDDGGVRAGEVGEPGRAALTFSVTLPGGAVLRTRHHARDPLPSDDTAAVVLPPPARPRLALVAPDGRPDPFLAGLLRDFEPRSLTVLTPAALEAELAEPLAPNRYDVLIFDRAAPAVLPDLPSLSFGVAPPPFANEPHPEPVGQRVLSWSRQHPIMRHVDLDATVVATAMRLRLPDGAETLATGSHGPLVAVLDQAGVPHVVVAFALAESNWPALVSVAVFLQNVLDRLTGAGSGQVSLGVRPGESVSVRPAPGVTSLIVTGADEQPITIPVRSDGGGEPTPLPAFSRVGLYAVRDALPPGNQIAVSGLSEVESDTRPRRSLQVNAVRVAAGAADRAAPRGLWPWLVGLALVLLIAEWLLYCRRLRE